jgi:phi13 family phage major tail protein
MPSASEYKPSVGLRDIYYALVSQDDASAYAAGTPAYLAPAMTANLAPAVNSETVYADDGPYENMVSEGETAIEMEVTEIPLQQLAEITGTVYDATTASLLDNGGTPPLVALGFRAKKSNGGYKYYWYFKGKFTKPAEDKQSDSDTPNIKPAKLTYTALKTTYQWTMGGTTDGVKRRVVDSDNPGTTTVANWFTAVQVPAYGGAPSFTLTASPANNATGVAVGVAPTLTFSNALATGTNGVILATAAGVVVTATYTINAARKIITITPGSNLGASTVHLISIADVTDIYGQKYADTVVKFTTA